MEGRRFQVYVALHLSRLMELCAEVVYLGHISTPIFHFYLNLSLAFFCSMNISGRFSTVGAMAEIGSEI